MDQLRDGQVDAAERALVKVVRKTFERDAVQLRVLDVSCNKQLLGPPPVMENTFGGDYGLGNEQKVREDIAVTGVDVTDLVDTLIEALLQAEAPEGPPPWDEALVQAIASESMELESPDALDLEDIHALRSSRTSRPTEQSVRRLCPIPLQPAPPSVAVMSHLSNVAVAAVARTITDDQLANKTPCTEYDVRAPVNHLLFWGPSLAGAGRKEPVPQPATTESDVDLAAGDWRGRLLALLDDVTSSWAPPSAWKGETSMGTPHTLPAPVMGRHDHRRAGRARLGARACFVLTSGLLAGVVGAACLGSSRRGLR